MQINLAPEISSNVSKNLSMYPEIIRQLLFNRGIENEQSAKVFFDPKKEFGDPFLLYGMDRAVEAILKAVREKKKIFIHGDYDVDGVCATSLIWDYLYRELKADVLPYIPSRFEEGYGMTDSSINQIVENGGQLIISVDCGVKDIELVRKFKKGKGLEFIITDHHTLLQDKKGNSVVSEGAIAVIHPSHPKSKYKFKELCGTAVAWKLVCAISSNLGKSVLKNDKYLELVALATSCDVMPLVGENRAIVKFGLEKLKDTDIIGLRILMLEAGIDLQKIEAYHLGFVIGPRINAAGRIEHAMDALRLLTTTDTEKAREYAEKLSKLNLKRQEITQELIAKAEEQILAKGKEKKLYFVWGVEWPEGVVGLVAGKLTEKYSRPVIVATKNREEVKGSARSTSALNIVEAIGNYSHILERFGGHSQAAGFSLKPEHLELFIENLEKYAEETLTEEDVAGSVNVDMSLDLSDITIELAEWLEKFKPFGFENITPSFLLENVRLVEKMEVGKDGAHTRAVVEQDGKRLVGIGFFMSEKFKNIEVGDEISLCSTIELDEWNEQRRVQMKIKNIV
ncbi:single-stranded-DNA-specific exonuclease RecJ [Candidatus Dojkabacteria bacterium]|nr:single-stranded-DNA-specific exonuclease RecJ [Candidatus Dojkabacteria bacterium]